MKPLTLVMFASLLVLAPMSAQAAPCEAGTFSIDGQEPCTPCSAGTYSGSPGATSCAACDPHTWSGEASTVCQDCPFDSYQPEAGTSTCLWRNDWSCWSVKDLKNPAAFTPMRDVAASDEISTEPVSLIRPSRICVTAAIESRFPGANPESKLCCYKAAGAKPDAPVLIEATSALGGTLQLRVVKRGLVCDQCQGTAETEQTLQCWKVKDLKNPKFSIIDGLRVFDEYDFDFIRVKKPALFCAPASIDGSPLVDTNGQQCCYKAGKAYRSNTSESVTDPLGGPLELRVVRRSMICEPCAVSALP